MSFYDELINGTLRTEKTASSKGDVEKVLGSLSDDQIEALAEEIGLLTKEATEGNTVEEKATEKTRNTESDAEKDLVDSNNKSTKDKVPAEDAVQEKAKSESTVRDDDNEDKKKEQAGSPTPADSGKSDEEYELTASEMLESLLKEGAELEGKAVKDAYIVAENMLKEANLTVENYVMSKVAHEGVANVIAEKAEKLAAVTGKPVLQVADDLITGIANIIEE